jgi:RNA polymerase sigma factor (TIGR02999 family)
MSDSPAPAPVTRLLADLRHGRREVLDELMVAVYDELRVIARYRMSHENAGHTLQATALVHEAFSRLVDQDVTFKDRAHFLAIAATCMKRVLLDHARRRDAAKRPPKAAAIDIADALVLSDEQLEQVIAVSEALDRLRQLDERQADVAELRYFAGATIDEIAEHLSIAPATVKREWDTAKMFLNHALRSIHDDA